MLRISCDESRNGYYYDVYEQPLHNKIISMAYHKYDMITGKVIIKYIDPIQLKLFPDREFPVSAKQDFRCYALSIKNRKHIASTELVTETPLETEESPDS